MVWGKPNSWHWMVGRFDCGSLVWLLFGLVWCAGPVEGSLLVAVVVWWGSCAVAGILTSLAGGLLLLWCGWWDGGSA